MWKKTLIVFFRDVQNAGRVIYYLFRIRKMFLKNGNVLNADMLLRKDDFNLK